MPLVQLGPEHRQQRIPPQESCGRRTGQVGYEGQKLGLQVCFLLHAARFTQDMRGTENMELIHVQSTALTQ
jgi:hypothetical protein